MTSLTRDHVDCFLADYYNPRHGNAIVDLLDQYAREPMGGKQPLSEAVKKNLVSELQKLPYAFSVLCFVADKPAGLANCFFGFSTFACKPLVNVHDFIVQSAFRGLNISQALLGFTEEYALRSGCCKVTLEVLQGNTIARKAYEKFGFQPYQLDATLGRALFLEKKLPDVGV